LSPEKKKRKKVEEGASEQNMQTLQFYGKGSKKKNYSSKDGLQGEQKPNLDYMTPQ